MMDDFRVGSVPSSDPFGQRQRPGSIVRKREKQPGGEDGGQQDDAADTVGTLPAPDDQLDDSGEPIEDYYLPSDPSGDME
jgi:hypothetical protein